VLTEHADWSWVFLINVPVGVLAIVASYLLIDESKDDSPDKRVDLAGQVTGALGLFSLTFALIEGNSYGWSSGRILLAFAVAAVSAVAFVLVESRQRAPMLDLSLFRNRTYTGANVVVLLTALAMFGVFFFVSLYMQNVLGFSPVEAGAAFLPMTVLIVGIAPIAGKATDRIGSRRLMTAGLVLLAAQLLYLSRLGVDESFWTLLPGMVLGGLGMALKMTPSAAAAVRSVPVQKAGVGGAVLNACRQVGGSLGIAVMGAIMVHQTGGSRSPEAFVHGFSVALEFAAAVALVGAVVAAVLVRAHEVEPPAQVPVEAAA
jgi:EmrB/QacA subfamily drug resistance transporter